MKKTVILTAVALCSTAVWAQEQGRVLSATPIVQQVGVPQQVCGNETVYSGSRNSGAGAVMGAIAGGAAGNAIGKGNGRVAATALGVIGGAVQATRLKEAAAPSTKPCSAARPKRILKIVRWATTWCMNTQVANTPLAPSTTQANGFLSPSSHR